MVINLTRYRTAIIISLILVVVAGLAGGLCSFNKKQPSGVAPPAKDVVYGQFLKWEEAARIFPKYAEAEIIDFETRKSFRVQRRAGSRHADVQPLTARDTKIMKEIYQGKWSWKRRSVIVSLDDGTRIAASMAGMPHGQGAIKGNRFNGHFCLHFAESRVHGSGKVDLAHQMMIWKAAGLLEHKLTAMPHKEYLLAFFTAIDQGDKSIACEMVCQEDQAYLVKYMDSIDSIRVSSLTPVSGRCFKASLGVRGRDQRIRIKEGQIALKPAGKSWLIDYHSMRSWFE